MKARTPKNRIGIQKLSEKYTEIRDGKTTNRERTNNEHV